MLFSFRIRLFILHVRVWYFIYKNNILYGCGRPGKSLTPSQRALISFFYNEIRVSRKVLSAASNIYLYRVNKVGYLSQQDLTDINRNWRRKLINEGKLEVWRVLTRGLLKQKVWKVMAVANRLINKRRVKKNDHY